MLRDVYTLHAVLSSVLLFSVKAKLITADVKTDCATKTAPVSSNLQFVVVVHNPFFAQQRQIINKKQLVVPAN